MTEKLSIETLLDPDLMADGFLKYVWKNMVTEGTEEGASNLLNTFADILISGDQSQWAQNVEKYRAQGYSDAAARERALGDQARSLGLDVLGGMLSGGLLSGGYGGVNTNFAAGRGDSRIARGNGNSVSAAQSNVIQSLTAVAHTPLEKRALSQYKSAVELLVNRQRVLTDTQSKLQRLAAAGDVHSAEYNRLKSAELELNRKVSDAQQRVDRLKAGASIRGLREKAENSSGLENTENGDIIDLYRRKGNTGAFSGLSERMSKKHIRSIAKEYNIDLKGLTLNIDYNEELLRFQFAGRADPEHIGGITFFPNAFTSKEELLRTLYHEKVHVEQFREYGTIYVQENRGYFEKLAYEAEEKFIQSLKQKGVI